MRAENWHIAYSMHAVMMVSSRSMMSYHRATWLIMDQSYQDPEQLSCHVSRRDTMIYGLVGLALGTLRDQEAVAEQVCKVNRSLWLWSDDVFLLLLCIMVLFSICGDVDICSYIICIGSCSLHKLLLVPPPLV